MDIQQLITRIEGSIDDLGAVLSDLKDARDGEIPLDEVNVAYAQQAVSRVHSVIDEINAADMS